MLKILALQSSKSDGEITDDEAEKIIAGYDKDEQIREDEEGNKYILTSKNNKVYVSSIWSGNTSAGDWKDNGDNTFSIVSDGKTVTVKIGDYIDYSPNGGPYTSPTGTYIETTYESDMKGDFAGAPADSLERGSGYFTTQTFTPSEYSGGWRVLGLSNGNLQLISANSVGTYYLRGYTGATYGVTELNNICRKYGNSNYTSNVRSVTVDDVNKITGYNPNNVGKYDPEQKETGSKYGIGTIAEYGNEVTYTWGTSSSDVSGIGTNGATGSYSSYKYGFNYITNAGKWICSTFSSGIKIATLKSTYYTYNPDTLTVGTSETVGIEATSNAYQTLFCNSSGSTMNYWLASPFVWDASYVVYFGLRGVINGYVGTRTEAYSDGRIEGPGLGVRPVITLKSGVIVSNEGGKTGTDKETAYTLVLPIE